MDFFDDLHFDCCIKNRWLGVFRGKCFHQKLNYTPEKFSFTFHIYTTWSYLKPRKILFQFKVHLGRRIRQKYVVRCSFMFRAMSVPPAWQKRRYNGKWTPLSRSGTRNKKLYGYRQMNVWSSLLEQIYTGLSSAVEYSATAAEYADSIANQTARHEIVSMALWWMTNDFPESHLFATFECWHCTMLDRTSYSNACGPLS